MFDGLQCIWNPVKHSLTHTKNSHIFVFTNIWPKYNNAICKCIFVFFFRNFLRWGGGCMQPKITHVSGYLPTGKQAEM